MEYLQYIAGIFTGGMWVNNPCFKPCYKWNTFNTDSRQKVLLSNTKVLNLVRSGIPSILVVTFTNTIIVEI